MVTGLTITALVYPAGTAVEATQVPAMAFWEL